MCKHACPASISMKPTTKNLLSLMSAVGICLAATPAHAIVIPDTLIEYLGIAQNPNGYYGGESITPDIEIVQSNAASVYGGLTFNTYGNFHAHFTVTDASASTWSKYQFIFYADRFLSPPFDEASAYYAQLASSGRPLDVELSAASSNRYSTLTTEVKGSLVIYTFGSRMEGPPGPLTFDFTFSNQSAKLQDLGVAQSAISAVPEPDSLAYSLAGLGLFGILKRRREVLGCWRRPKTEPLLKGVPPLN